MGRSLPTPALKYLICQLSKTNCISFANLELKMHENVANVESSLVS